MAGPYKQYMYFLCTGQLCSKVYDISQLQGLAQAVPGDEGHGRGSEQRADNKKHPLAALAALGLQVEDASGPGQQSFAAGSSGVQQDAAAAVRNGKEVRGVASIGEGGSFRGLLCLAPGDAQMTECLLPAAVEQRKTLCTICRCRRHLCASQEDA
jgi:hypothetical protein